MGLSSKLIKAVPILDWLPRYNRSWLGGDVIAGVIVAMLLVPQAMSYAILAGLPPEIGLYASVVPLFIYAIFGTSRQIAVGPAAMVALLVSTSVGSIAAAGSAEFLQLAITLALLAGAIQLVMALTGLGFLTNFMSHPVISGFTSAAAIIIIFSQLGALTGLSLPRTENILVIAQNFLSAADQVQAISLAIGVGSLVLLIALKRLYPTFPGPMLVLVIATLAVWLFKLDQIGVEVVGDIPQGLPAINLPQLNPDSLITLLPAAVTLAFISFIESIAVAQKFARQHGYDIRANQELAGLGLANMAGSLFQAMPVAGGFGRSAVNNSAGANTQIAALITGLLVALSLILLTPLFYYIPKAALAAVIVQAVFGLIDRGEVAHLWKVKKEDLVLLTFTFFATLVIGVKEGILSGMAVSMVWFVIKTTRPHYAVLGKLPETSDYRNIKRHQVETYESLLILRFDAQFYYGNVSFLKDTIHKHLEEQGNDLKCIVIDACSINQLDSSADSALHQLVDESRLKGLQFYFAQVKGPVLDVMKRSGFYQKLGDQFFFNHIDQAVRAARQHLGQIQ